MNIDAKKKTKTIKPALITSKHTLVYLSRLSSTEKAAAFRASDIFLAAQLRANFNNCVVDVLLDRLVRAQQCLELAKRLAKAYEKKPADEESLRGAIGRAYYSMHHSLRAMAFHQLEYDPDSHDESIAVFTKLLNNNAFRARTGLKKRAAENVSEAKINRSIADYSPYNMSRHPESMAWMQLTGEDWTKAANFNIRWAEKILGGAMKLVGLS